MYIENKESEKRKGKGVDEELIKKKEKKDKKDKCLFYTSNVCFTKLI